MRHEAIWLKSVVLPVFTFVLFAVGVSMIPKFGLLLIVAVMLLLSGFTFSSFSTPKYVGLASGVAGVWAGFVSRVHSPLIHVPVFYAVAIILVLILAFLRGFRWRVSWWGTLDRMLGGITWLWVLLYSVWVYEAVNLGFIGIWDVFTVISVSWLIEVAIFLLQHFRIAFVFSGLNPGPGRTVGTIGNPLSLNQFLFLAGAGAVEWLHYFDGGLVWLELLLAFLVVALVLLNFKRTTAVASLISLVGLSVYGLWVGRGQLWLWLAVLILLMVVGLLYWKYGIHRRLQRALKQYAAYRYLVRKYGPHVPLMIIGPAFTRPYIWISALVLWLKSPIWGYGFEQIRRYLMEVRHPYTYYAEHQRGYDRSHNWFLDLLVEGGLLWFIFVIFWLFSGVRAFSSFPALVLFGAYVIHLLFLFNEISAMTMWAAIAPLSGICGSSNLILPVWVFLAVIPVALLAVLRNLADIYAGYGRAIRQRNLSGGRERYRFALEVFPFQDEYIMRLVETDVLILRAADGAGNVSGELVKELVSEILDFERHVSVTNYPDTLLGYLGYAYGWLSRLGCEECKQKAINLFESALSVNPYNEEVVSLFANFLGNIGAWNEAVDVLIGYLRRKLGDDGFEVVCKKIYRVAEDYLQFAGSGERVRSFLAKLPKSRPGWIGENIVKMAIFAAVRAGNKVLAEKLLKLYECLYVEKDEYFYDEMFIALKTLKS